jgi:hypothetical protein
MRPILLLIVGLLAVVAGCGGGESTSSAPPPTEAQLAARQEFVAKANRFCERARVEGERKGVSVFEAKARYYKRKGTLEQYRGSIKRQEIAIVLAPSMLRRVGEIRALGIPPRDRRQVEKILGEIQKAARYATESPFGFLEENSLAPARDLARAYGIESCAVLYDRKGVFQKVSESPGARLTPRSSK